MLTGNVVVVEVVETRDECGRTTKCGDQGGLVMGNEADAVRPRFL